MNKSHIILFIRVHHDGTGDRNHDAILLDPVEVLRTQRRDVPEVCRYHHWHPPEGHLVGKVLCGRLPQPGTISVLLQELLIVAHKSWASNVVKHDGFMLQRIESMKVWVARMLAVHN